MAQRPPLTAAVGEHRSCAVTIATTDSGGGAGIAADLRTFHELGVHGACVVAAATAQNTVGVQGLYELPAQFLTQQLDAVADDIPLAAAKTGALPSTDLIVAAADGLRRHGAARLVVDPVAVSKHGDSLLAADAVSALRSELLPLALVATPNVQEVQVLTGVEIKDTTDLHRAADAVLELGPKWVLVKGGSIQGPLAVDLLTDGSEAVEVVAPHFDRRHTHGSGCTLAAAITAELARGMSVTDAVWSAKRFVTGAIRSGFALGRGIAVADALWRHVSHDLDVRPGVAVVLRDDDGRVLLHKRRVGGGWAPVSGAVEPGESIEDAAHRELVEETTLRAELDGVVKVYSDPAFQVVEYPDGRRVHFVTTVFAAHVTAGQLRGSDEGEAWAWFDVGRLPSDLLDYARVWLGDALRA